MSALLLVRIARLEWKDHARRVFDDGKMREPWQPLEGLVLLASPTVTEMSSRSWQTPAICKRQKAKKRGDSSLLRFSATCYFPSVSAALARFSESGFLATNQKVGSSNLSGRATFSFSLIQLQNLRDLVVVLWKFTVTEM